MKCVVFLGDGMADTPVPALGNKTPLEAARHPSMDFLASRGKFGKTRTVPFGMPPGSDTANLSVFGYDPEIYYSGRSPLEAASMGIPLAPEDVTYRCNTVTLSEEENIEDCRMLDYSAGEITSAESRELIEYLQTQLMRKGWELHPGISYRHCLVLRNAETGAELTPPHDISGQSVRGRLPGGQNGALLREWMEHSRSLLREHPINKKRVAEGKSPANCLWFWGEGRKPALDLFREKYGIERGAVISAVDLIQGIGVCAGLEVLKVENITGNYHTDFAAKGRAAIEAFKNGCEFVYIHVEAPDECGHHGEIQEKVFSIEQIDEKIILPVLEYLQGTGEPFAALCMPDHPTPLAVLTHTAEPVPFALYRSDSEEDHPMRFTEQESAETGVFVEKACTLMAELTRLT